MQVRLVEDKAQSYEDRMAFGKSEYSQRFNPLNASLASHKSSFATSFRVVSTTSPNCVSVSQIEVKAGRLNRIPLAQFIIDEGKIAGFEVHPSKDYLLVTSTHGRVYVFRIDTGELRGSIEVPNHARGCLIDPSGLYVVVQVPPLSQ